MLKTRRWHTVVKTNPLIKWSDHYSVFWACNQPKKILVDWNSTYSNTNPLVDGGKRSACYLLFNWIGHSALGVPYLVALCVHQSVLFPVTRLDMNTCPRQVNSLVHANGCLEWKTHVISTEILSESKLRTVMLSHLITVRKFVSPQTVEHDSWEKSDILDTMSWAT